MNRTNAWEMTKLRNVRTENSPSRTVDAATAPVRPGAARNARRAGASLLPGFAAADGRILHLETGRLLPDVPLFEIPFSVRAANCLHRAKIRTLSGLLALSPRELSSLSNLGAKTAAEILDKCSEYLNRAAADETAPLARPAPALPVAESVFPVLAPDFTVQNGIILHRTSGQTVPDGSLRLLKLGTRARQCLFRNRILRISDLINMETQRLKEMKNLGAKSLEEISQRLEEYLNDELKAGLNRQLPEKPSRSELEKRILRLFDARPFDPLTPEEIESALEYRADSEDLQAAVEELLRSGKLIASRNRLKPSIPSFTEELTRRSFGKDASERSVMRFYRVLQGRLRGKTLEEISLEEGTTRERIRQIEQKGLRLFCQDRIFAEDRYRRLFERYAVDKAFYLSRDGSPALWYYLNARYERGKGDPSEAPRDPEIPLSVRKELEKWLFREYIREDGRYIPLSRTEIENFVLEKYCAEEKTLDEFFELYQAFLERHGLQNHEKLMLTEKVKRTRCNRLAEYRKILWKQNQRLRFYDIDAGDYGELLETLDLGRFRNVEYSARKFFLEYPDLMLRYGIRDEYELHNLLKKIGAEKENPTLIFGRMPNLLFGRFDRKKAMLEMLRAIAPVTAEEFAETISREYGHRPDTIKSNWLPDLTDYYSEGVYDVDQPELPEGHLEILKERLTEDFYFLREIREIYREAAGGDPSAPGSRHLRQLGFQVNATYAFKNYPSAEAYFAALLTKNDLTDARPFHARFSALQSYSGKLAALKDRFEIVEYLPLQYIHIRKLREMGIEIDDLRAFGNEVRAFFDRREFFTVRYLKNLGFRSALDRYGFDDWFYTSLLREDSRFSFRRIGHNVVFFPGAEKISARDVLVRFVERFGSVSPADLATYLQKEYDIRLDPYAVAEKLRGTRIRYDRSAKILVAER